MNCRIKCTPTCFLCNGQEVEAQNFSSTFTLTSDVDEEVENSVSVFLCQILGVPYLGRKFQNYTEINSSKIFYCDPCTIRIFSIQDLLEKFEKLRKEVLEEIFLIESKLRENLDKIQNLNQDIGENYPKKFCAEILNELNSNSIRTNIKDVLIKQVDKKLRLSNEIRIMRNVDIIKKNLNIESDEIVELQAAFSDVEEFDFTSDDLGQDEVQSCIQDQCSSTEPVDLGEVINEDKSGFKIQSFGFKYMKFEPEIRKEEELTISQVESHICKMKEEYKELRASKVLKLKQGVKSFNCQYCNKVISRRHIRIHELTHIGQNPYKCDKCDKSFLRPYSLRIHLQVHIKERELFLCQYCEKSFDYQVGLQNHERTHTGDKHYKCKYCPEEFGTRNQCSVHESKCDHKEVEFEIQLISSGTVNKGQEEIESSIPGVDIIIGKGEKIEGRRRKLKLTEGLEPGVQFFNCKYCDKVISRRHIRIHELTHIGQNPYKCDKCNKSFLRLYSLRTHQLVHTKEKPFLCQFCEKSFGYEVSLKNHERTHTGEKPYNCRYCSESFGSVNIRSVHESDHKDDKLLCQYCERTFKYPGDLRNHESEHTGLKRFPCKSCEKGFKSMSLLKKHELSHTGEKPFKCQYCEKSFTGKSSVKRHELVHTGEKPHKCKYCEKAFNVRSNLRKHEQVHAKKEQNS